LQERLQTGSWSRRICSFPLLYFRKFGK